ncbi:MAG: hypothetical protein V6Z86_05160 [Hyphomicrobiales bacterium]
MDHRIARSGGDHTTGRDSSYGRESHSESHDSGGDSKSGGKDGGGRVICTELMKRRLLSAADWRLDCLHAMTRLSPATVRGYHAWGIRVVEHHLRNPDSSIRTDPVGRVSERLWRFIARHRAAEIAYVMGRRARPHWPGRMIRLAFEPTCWLIGQCVDEQPWQRIHPELSRG